MRFDKFTTKFQQAFADAQSLAVGQDNPYIEPQHLLQALLQQEDGGTASLLSRSGVNVPALKTALAAALKRLPKVEGQGGEVRCHSPVDSIIVRDGQARGVRLESGREIAADIVVSNADSAWTYRHLLPESARNRWTNRKIDNARYSMGLFVWYFGVNRKYNDVLHHTIMMGPRYRELLDDIFHKKTLAEDFSLYLHRPTATDPSLAPEGCDAFYVLSPVPNLLGGQDWHVQAERYRQSIEHLLEETVLPGLHEAIVTSRMMTPQDFKDQLNSYHGAGFGLEPVLGGRLLDGIHDGLAVVSQPDGYGLHIWLIPAHGTEGCSLFTQRQHRMEKCS